MPTELIPVIALGVAVLGAAVIIVLLQRRPGTGFKVKVSDVEIESAAETRDEPPPGRGITISGSTLRRVRVESTGGEPVWINRSRLVRAVVRALPGRRAKS
jgi:hypothetical protein